MTKNFLKLKKDLKSFAKRVKDFKYTDKVLVVFLLTGTIGMENNLFAVQATDTTIENQIKQINTSVNNFKQNLKKTKNENKKSIKQLNLELIQLMEQGDHVIKSTWSNWQYGMNYFYNNHSGVYKGFGDKAEKYSYEGIFERNTNLFGRNISPLSKYYGNLPLDRNRKMASSNERNGLQSTYGLISSTSTQEPLLEINVNASIRPKTVQIEIPDLGIKAPQLNALSVNGVEPKAVTVPTPKTPEKEVSIVQPNASPFTGFFFNGANGELPNNSNNADTIYYAGVNPDVIKAKITANQPLENVGPDPNNLNTGALKKSDLSTILNHNKHPTNILYRWGVNLNNLTFYIRGYFDDGSDGYIDDGSGHTGGSDPSGGSTLGTIGVHTLLNSTVSNITANLYGRAGFLTSETWKHGKVTMVNTNVNVYGKENSVYYIMPGAFTSIAVNINNTYYLGALRGTTNVKIYGTGNTVYLSSGISGPRLIVNDGKIESEGASNIIYSSFSYAPNWEKSLYSRGTNEMNSAIQLTSDNNLYGDENVVLFLGSKMGGTTTPKSWGLADKNNEIAHGYLTKASYIGIYQGEIDVKATIGKQLAIDSTATTQTINGQLVEDLSNPLIPKYKGYTNKTVDGGVGLYVTSGQRIGIDAIRDLGVPVTYVPDLASFSNDSIHNLEVGKMDIRFGKYSKNGFMVISKLGSVVDVGKASTNYHVTTTSSSITDGINGATTSEADTSTGTTIAYAEGTWDQFKHQLGSKQTDVNQNDADAGSKLSIGNSSYGFINEGSGNKIISNMTSQSVGDNTVFVFSRDTSGTVINNTPLTSTGSLNYGLYSSGTVTNNANINYGSGIGNVGIYSTNGGTAVNSTGVTITVGESSVGNADPKENKYAIGMAAGYFGDATTPAYTGNIVNNGIINVGTGTKVTETRSDGTPFERYIGENSIGMYGTGSGTKVTNNGTINLNASNTTGMYLDNGAYGINNGIIKSNRTGLKKVVGVVVKNGSTIENNGTIEINASEAVGLLAKGNAAGKNIGKIKNYGTLKITGSGAQDSQVPQEGQEIAKDMAGIKIHAPAGSSTATITVNGVPVVPELATTTGEEYKPMEVSTIGMYIDTSNKRFTTPVVGLSNLSTLTNADLIIGSEAAQNTTGKYIQISPQILAPYNRTILNNPQIEKWNIYSGSLTWMASVAQNQTDGTIENAYLAKIPYTKWAGSQNTPVNSTDTYNFLDGLEQRYGAKTLGTREKLLFDKISGIGNNEEILFYQATDEMMGHQYGNLQQRINATGNLLDKEFSHLKRDWRNPSKQNNKIKVFGMRDEYNTDTAGIIDYTSNAYGVAYVHEDEKIKMGNSSGWYAGAVTNRFKFKDIGHSKENQTILKAGVFKTMSPKKDYNGALQWTIGGDVFVGINDMKRRYLVVDEVFQAKSDYHSYGAALKTDLGYDIRMSERTHFRPYGALKMEYGKFNNIKEDRGEMRLEVKGNDYFSVKPEVGMEFRYVQPLAVRTNLTVGLTAAYENELGKVEDVDNKARVRYTTADWFGIRGEKEDRKGNGKFDLNIGVDNIRFGVTINGGYDTKGKNTRGGVGFRVIY